ncbi:MAG: SH3 domain-containing protein [Candidatus Riflebacteria bacterium]|nr:SH3 domain-containing protein [Candidatus Riflebacteria bacterium]
MVSKKLVLLCSAGMLLSQGQATAGPFARVKLYAVSLLSEPGAGGHRLQRFYLGRRLEVVDDESNQYFVKVRADGREGWVFRRYVTFDPAPEEVYPPADTEVSSEFLASDRNSNAVPDYLEIVQSARTFIGRFFDDFNKIGGPDGPYQGAVNEARWATRYLAEGSEAAGPPPSEVRESAADIAIPDSFGLPDGIHWQWSIDEQDNNGDGRVDEPLEEVMVCVDLCTASYEAAGYPISKMILDSAGLKDQVRWSMGVWVSRSKPYYSRNLDILVPFLKRSPMFKYFPEPELRSPDATPSEPFRPGDMIFFGLTKDLGTSKFHLCHSAIVSEVDSQTGMPLTVITCVVPRVIEFRLDNSYDRWTILGHARPNFESGPAETE